MDYNEVQICFNLVDMPAIYFPLPFISFIDHVWGKRNIYTELRSPLIVSFEDYPMFVVLIIQVTRVIRTQRHPKYFISDLNKALQALSMENKNQIRISTKYICKNKCILKSAWTYVYLA